MRPDFDWPEHCDRCGRYLNTNATGVSWCQTYTPPHDLNDPTYRCSPCTDKFGIKPTNCNESERPYHGRNPPVAGTEER